MKKFRLLILLLVVTLLPLNVFASTNTQDRNTLSNLGVNKKWEITDNNRSNVLNSYKVDASEKIYDFADILSDQDEEWLYDTIQDFIKKYNMDLVVLTDKFSYSNDKENEDYAADFYDYNDFGIDFDKYNGIIIFINMNPTDRYFNFYMFGDAQLYFDNTRKQEPIDKAMNSMKAGSYYTAVRSMISCFKDYIDDGVPYALEEYYVDDMGYLQKDSKFLKHTRPIRPFRPPWVGMIGADLLIVLITMIILVKKNRMVKKKLVMTEYVNKNGADYRVKNDQFIRSYVTSHTVSSSSGGSGGGGFSSSGGSSGGGHSSGGGGHF